MAVACALLSGCSTRGNLTPQQLAVLKREKATLEVQSGRCKDFGLYAAEQLFRARDEDRAACDLKCYPDFTPAQRKEEQEIELGGPGFNFYGLPVGAKQEQSCFERFAECRGAIFEAERRRLDEENPAPSVAKPSVLQDSMDKVEFDDTRSRCEYLDDEIRDLDSRIYYGDPRNCAGPCWMN